MKFQLVEVIRLLFYMLQALGSYFRILTFVICSFLTISCFPCRQDLQDLGEIDLVLYTITCYITHQGLALICNACCAANLSFR